MKATIEACIEGAKALPDGEQADAIDGLADLLVASGRVPESMVSALRRLANNIRETAASRREVLMEQLELFPPCKTN